MKRVAEGPGEGGAGLVEFERSADFALLHARPGQYLETESRQSILALGFGDLERLLSVSDSSAILREREGDQTAASRERVPPAQSRQPGLWSLQLPRQRLCALDGMITRAPELAQDRRQS